MFFTDRELFWFTVGSVHGLVTYRLSYKADLPGEIVSLYLKHPTVLPMKHREGHALQGFVAVPRV
jgi:hypothetical protein